MKKIDNITALLLFFLLFIIVLFSYIVKVDRDIKKYGQFHDAVSEIKLIDQSFDNFLIRKSTFTNYDDINLKISRFEKKIDFLDSEYSRNLFSKEYTFLISDLKNKFEQKHNFIESFKSKNATLLNSMHYVLDLRNTIIKDDKYIEKIKKIVNDQTLQLMKYYINIYIDNKIILENSNTLLKILKEKHFNGELELFILHTNKNIITIEALNVIENSLNQDVLLSRSIKNIHMYLDEDYNKKLLIERVIVVIIFIIAVIILLILFVKHKEALQTKYELLGFKLAVENSDNSIVIADANKNITYVNESFEKETGYKKEEVLGKNPRILKSGKMAQSIYDDLNATINSGDKWEGELINVRKDGSIYYEKASIIPIFIKNKLKNYLAIKLNITDYIEQKQEVEFLALHDFLTSLPNRLFIEKSILKKMQTAKLKDSKIFMFYIDLDRFKIINDTLGHDVGDEMLIEASNRIQASLRGSDIVARVGGDEFIILSETLHTNDEAKVVCERIIKLFAEPIQTKKHLLNITLSIGVAVFPDDAKDYQTLLKHADIAMYQAKDSGKNTFSFYQKRLFDDAKNRLNMEQAFKNAIDNNEFYMLYQPKYTLEDKKIVGLEALVRWKNETLGFIGPDKFIPIAEDTGFILELGLFIFKQACKDFLIFRQCAKSLEKISINVSAVQLYQENFVDNLISIIKEVGIDSKSIVIEITETYIMKNVEHSMKILNELKMVGFSISIDDFGTGHSSLNYLKKFPIDELKIDKSFVDGIPNDQNDTSIVQAIISMSKSLGYVNVAEGIENEDQEKFLLDSYCALGQGFHFCRPKTKDELIEFLNS